MSPKRRRGRPTNERRLPLRTTIREGRLKWLQEEARETGRGQGVIIDQSLDKTHPLPKKGGD